MPASACLHNGCRQGPVYYDPCHMMGTELHAHYVHTICKLN